MKHDQFMVTCYSLKLSNISTPLSTPLNINMEHKNHPIEKEKSSSIHLHFWVQNVNFPGPV